MLPVTLATSISPPKLLLMMTVVLRGTVMVNSPPLLGQLSVP